MCIQICSLVKQTHTLSLSSLSHIHLLQILSRPLTYPFFYLQYHPTATAATLVTHSDSYILCCMIPYAFVDILSISYDVIFTRECDGPVRL